MTIAKKPAKPKKKKIQKPDIKKTGASGTTEIVCIIDRSGSMDAIKTDAIGGFNRFLTDQKKEPGKSTMTIVMFDHEYQIVNSGTPLQDIKPLNDTIFVPRGSTALLDAIGRTINEVNSRNPNKVLIMILTDGHENSSKEFLKSQIKTMIADCEKKGWCVIYLSADQNSFDDGHSIGLGSNKIMSFTNDQKGAHVSTMAASYATSDYRRSGRIGGMSAYSMRANNEYDNRCLNKPKIH
jgi:uncharacterized protein YegL